MGEKIRSLSSDMLHFDGKSAVGYMSLKLRKEVQIEDRNVGVISM